METQKSSKHHLTSHYSCVNIFDHVAGAYLKGLEIAHCNPSIIEREEKCEDDHDVNNDHQKSKKIPTVSESMYCHCCQTDFADRDDQLLHYKCDWHRYNLHLRLRGLPGISDEEFEKVAGDLSSISGSDEGSDDESNTLNIGIQSAVEGDGSLKEADILPSERKFHKIFFKNGREELLSLYRCLLHHKKKPLTSSSELCTAACQVTSKPKWAIFMVSASHFAGAVFNGNEILEHKTFHRYTVRAKRGSAQSSRDSHGNAPKSGGSSLRRYNEAALVQDVQELLSKWLNYLKSCDLIFAHIPVANRGMFYAGKNPPFRKDDDRIRIIPFPTRRPTFNELKRVRQMLVSIECYGQEADVRDFIPMSPPRMFNKDSGKLELCPPKSPKPSKRNVKDSQNVEIVKTEVKHIKSNDPENQSQSDSTENESPEEEACLVEEVVHIDVAANLKEFDSSVNKRKKKKKAKKTQDYKCETAQEEQLVDEEERLLRNSIFTACKLGDFESLYKAIGEIKKLPQCNSETAVPSNFNGTSISVLNENDPQSSEIEITDGIRTMDISTQNNDTEHMENSTQENVTSHTGVSTENKDTECKRPQDEDVVFSRIFNTPINVNGNTYLHLTSSEGHCDLIAVLLDNGADPTVKNRSGKLAYNLGSVDVRNAFRRFMAQCPDRYDYAKAQIPAPLTAEMEDQKRQKLAKRRAEKKKATQEKNKVKKAAEKQINEEEQEKSRFLSLSDREKRALAAEKRILQHHIAEGSSTPVLSRCWQCGLDISGKVPFEYANFKFCTTKCLRDHRGIAKS